MDDECAVVACNITDGRCLLDRSADPACAPASLATKILGAFVIVLAIVAAIAVPLAAFLLARGGRKPKFP
jgi:hypothetical protein